MTDVRVHYPLLRPDNFCNESLVLRSALTYASSASYLHAKGKSHPMDRRVVQLLTVLENIGHIRVKSHCRSSSPSSKPRNLCHPRMINLKTSRSKTSIRTTKQSRNWSAIVISDLKRDSDASVYITTCHNKWGTSKSFIYAYCSNDSAILYASSRITLPAYYVGVLLLRPC